jgi:hypothetical protein
MLATAPVERAGYFIFAWTMSASWRVAAVLSPLAAIDCQVALVATRHFLRHLTGRNGR